MLTFSTSGIVCMGPAAPCGKKRDLEAPYNVTLSDAVNVIPVKKDSDRKICGVPH